MSMTENEAKKLMQNEIVCINTADHNECNRDCASCSLVKETDELLEAYNVAINALEEIQQYRELGTVEEIIKVFNNQRKIIATQHETLKQYRAIGTIEEFKALKEDKKFLEFLYNHILPNEIEQYLSMYHTKDKVAVNGYADQSGLMSAT